MANVQRVTRSEPIALVICGSPGSGKSTLAKAVGTLLDLPVVDIDDLVNAISPEIVRNLETTDAFGLGKSVALHFLTIELAAGRSLILDVCFPDVEDWERLLRIVDSNDSQLAAFRLVAPFSILFERVTARAAAGSEHLMQHDEAKLRTIDDRATAAHDAMSKVLHELDATLPTTELAKQVLRQLG